VLHVLPRASGFTTVGRSEPCAHPALERWRTL